MAPSSRNYGLDLCRAVAILLVLASHWLETLSGAPESIPTLYLLTGYVGVELFFSLSGFLIGGILIDLAEGGLSGGAISIFYLRRWLRTLPAYYAVLAILCWIYGRFDAPSFLFVQYFVPGAANFLPVSWSLTMEEYFYLFFPLLILAFAHSRHKLPRGLTPVEAAALTLAILFPLLRLGAIIPRLPFPDLSFHGHPVMRLDCCAYGVLAACVQRRYPEQLRRFFQGWSPAAAFGLASLVVLAWIGLFLITADFPLFAFLKGNYWGPVYFALQGTLLDAPAAMAVLYASYRPAPPNRLFDAPVRLISRLSYSLYLVNGSVQAFLLAYTPLGHRMGLAALIVPLATLAAAGSIYLLVERPALALRDRFVRERPLAEPVLPFTPVP